MLRLLCLSCAAVLALALTATASASDPEKPRARGASADAESARVLECRRTPSGNASCLAHRMVDDSEDATWLPLTPGERITLQTKDASLVEILRTFARLAELNLIVGPDVDAPVTVEFVDVPWERALDHILRMHGLAAELDGNILSVGGGDTRISALRARGRPPGRVPGPP